MVRNYNNNNKINQKQEQQCRDTNKRWKTTKNITLLLLFIVGIFLFSTWNIITLFHHVHPFLGYYQNDNDKENYNKKLANLSQKGALDTFFIKQQQAKINSNDTLIPSQNKTLSTLKSFNHDKHKKWSKYSNENNNINNSFTKNNNDNNNNNNTLIHNAKNCRKPFKVIKQIKLSSPPLPPLHYNLHSLSKKSIRILCFIMTNTERHDRIRSIEQTWGKRCDGMVIASNGTDSKFSLLFNIVPMSSKATYDGLWVKLNETLQYINQTYFSNNDYNNDNDLLPFDWILKADGDTFIIMENLKAFLEQYTTNTTTATTTNKDNDSILPPSTTSTSTKPMIFGRLYSSPKYKNFEKAPKYFGHEKNQEFKKQFFQKMDRNHVVLYNYGGAGYVMNVPYLKLFCKVQKEIDTFHGGNPHEDVAHGIVMAYHGVWPKSTRDVHGRERFHQEDPTIMFDTPAHLVHLWNTSFQATGGYSPGRDCCSIQTISFHHVGINMMYAIDDQLYNCPAKENTKITK